MTEKTQWLCIPNRDKEMTPFFFLCFSRFRVERRSSYPYITGDTWRPLCEWRLTQDETFAPEDIQPGDRIFAEYQMLDAFSKMIAKIKSPFILITPNVENYSDAPLPGRFAKLLKHPNLAAWFLQNIDRPATDRLIPIPIGLPNTFWTSGPLEQNTHERDRWVYLNFNIDTNPEQRKPCFDYFSKMSWASNPGPKDFQEYLNDLSRSYFTVSPPGSGLDCHRTWEALYMGCYPIVLDSTLNSLYEELPVVVVRSWKDVTQEFLAAKKEEFQKHTWNWDKMYMPYWEEKAARLQALLKKYDPTDHTHRKKSIHRCK